MKRSLLLVGLLLLFGAALVFALFGKTSKPLLTSAMSPSINRNGGGMNGGRSPEVETLVRASDSAPTDQQAELLRATQYGKETPAEELLKATTTNEREEA